MKRIIMLGIVLVVVNGTLAVLGMPADADPTCHLQVFEGVATAVDCPEGTIVATYQYKDGVPPGAALDQTYPQTLFDNGVGSAHLPNCAYQADPLKPGTTVLKTIDADHQYGDSKAGEAVHGGDVACETTTSTTTTTTVPPTTDTVQDTVITRPTLAKTGTHSGTLSLTAIGLILMGAGLVLVARERKLVRSWKEL